VTVRVRGGEMTVTDGPFAETKEFIAGFDVLDASSPEQAIDYAAACPISWFQPIEIRPFADGLRVDDRALAFGEAQDGGARPHLLCPWVDPAQVADGEADELRAWRENVRARGIHVLGHGLSDAAQATTVRVRDGRRELGAGPFTAIPEVMTEIDVVNCANRAQAIELAGTHPLARRHAVEVRPFYVEDDYR
jgi:hypothetical protein